MVGLPIYAVLALSATPFLSLVTAHPGEVLSTLSIKRQAALTQSIAARGAEKLARCAESISAKALRKRAINRRTAKANILMKRASKRDAAEIEAYDISHNYTGDVTSDDAFDSNTSCILEPQLTIGPYWVEGELIRSDPTEDQTGVDMQLELQFVDINTCEPVSDLYIDLWNANSTGYYSGVDESSLDSTFLRAIQVTDDDGTVTFDTFVPGHYQGRAVHSHIMVHQNVTRYSNNTYAGGTVRSISQLFYDTKLRAAVESVEPYASNTNEITTNAEDGVLSGATLGAYDPFVKYIYLGDSINDGIFAWHSIGIDMTANYTSNEAAASHYYETGGVDESSSDSITGGPGGSFNGTGGPSNGSGVPPNMSGIPRGSAAPISTGTSSALDGLASITLSDTRTVHTFASSSKAGGADHDFVSSESKLLHSTEHSSKEPSFSTEHSSQKTTHSVEHSSQRSSLGGEHSSREPSLSAEHLPHETSHDPQRSSQKSSLGGEKSFIEKSVSAEHPTYKTTHGLEHSLQKTSLDGNHSSRTPSHSAEHSSQEATRIAEHALKETTHNAEQRSGLSCSLKSGTEATGSGSLSSFWTISTGIVSVHHKGKPVASSAP